jgi:hypothetical protein
MVNRRDDAPKLDGQRLQVSVADGRAVAACWGCPADLRVMSCLAAS